MRQVFFLNEIGDTMREGKVCDRERNGSASSQNRRTRNRGFVEGDALSVTTSLASPSTSKRPVPMWLPPCICTTGKEMRVWAGGR